MAREKDGVDLLKAAAEGAGEVEARLERGGDGAARLFPESFRASGTSAAVSAIDSIRKD